MSSSKRTVLITGYKLITYDATQRTMLIVFSCSTGGIGNALAREFHTQGLRVFATARNLAKVSDLQDLGIECFSLDVTDDDSIINCFNRISKEVGDEGLSFLVNNAGLCTSPPNGFSRVDQTDISSTLPPHNRDLTGSSSTDIRDKCPFCYDFNESIPPSPF